MESPYYWTIDMKLGLFFICFFYSLMSYSADIITIYVNKNRKDFVVNLPANPTTGFQWALVNYDKKRLHLINNHYTPKKTQLIGSGGQMEFRFGLNKNNIYPEKTNIVFRYARTWEKSSASLTNVIVLFDKK